MKIVKADRLFKATYKTAIIVLNWNGLDDTIACLFSIKQYVDSDDFVVILVDNNSTQSIDPLMDIDFELALIVIQNNENSGFAAGNNVGITQALLYNPEYILLLNNDTILVQNVLGLMVSAMDADSSIGVAGVVNYYFSDPSSIWQAGLSISLKSALISPVNIDFEKRVVDADYVPGSSLMFRCALIPVVGVLDENYFAYYEEVDFCIKVKKSNYRIVFLPNSKLLHKVGKSSPMAAKEYLRLRNRLYLFNKYSTKVDFSFIIVKEILKYLKSATKMFIKNGSFEYYKAVYKSVNDFSKNRFGKGSVDDFLKKK